MCKDKLPTEGWNAWIRLGKSWTVFKIMKTPEAGTGIDYWIDDWIYRMKGSRKLFYLHPVNKLDYDLMDAFDIPHTNADEYTYARGWKLK